MSAGILAAVAAGGALGAVLRAAALRLHRSGHRLPYATLAVNLMGSLLIGCLAGSALNPLWAAGLVSGVLGGFTTYSTFAVENARLYDAQRLRAGLLYIFLTLAGSTLAAALGYWMIKP